MLSDRFVGNVVRWLAARLGRERSAGPAMDQDVAVTDARMKLETAAQRGSQCLLECGNQLPAILRRDMPGGEVAHLFAIDVDEVAANRPIAWSQEQAHRGGLERRPAGVDLERVVAEQAERGDVACRG